MKGIFLLFKDMIVQYTDSCGVVIRPRPYTQMLDLRQMKRIVGSVALLAELVVLGYVMLLAFLLTAWMESDGFAAQATEIDWWIESGKRLLVVGGAATVFAIVVWLANNRLFRWLGYRNLRLSLWSAIAVFLLVAAAGAIGAVNFVITKPFM